MPFNYGLYETNIMVKPLKNNILNNILNIFFNYMLKFSYRDQTLLTYILWKYNYKDILLINDFVGNSYITSGEYCVHKKHQYV